MVVLAIVAVILGILVLAALSYYYLLKVEIPERQKVVIERLGKYHRTLEPGWHVKWPLLEKKKKFKEEDGQMTDYIDLRERTADLPKQQVITKDKIELTVDSVVYYEVSDAYKAVYAQKDVLGAIHQKIKTELRNVIGDTELDQLIKGQQEINEQLQTKLQESAKDWGLTLRSIELQSITPPENYKRVGEAELELEKAKLERQAAIERAEGRKQAHILEAEGEAEKINQIYSAIHKGNPSDELLKIKYLEALEKIAGGQATKIFMPFPANPTGDNFFQQAFGMAAGIDAYRAPGDAPALPAKESSSQPHGETERIDVAPAIPPAPERVKMFKISAKSLEQLKSNGIPEEISNALKPLLDKRIPNENVFLKKVEDCIGEELLKKFGKEPVDKTKKLLLEYAKIFIVKKDAA